MECDPVQCSDLTRWESTSFSVSDLNRLREEEARDRERGLIPRIAPPKPTKPPAAIPSPYVLQEEPPLPPEDEIKVNLVDETFVDKPAASSLSDENTFIDDGGLSQGADVSFDDQVTGDSSMPPHPVDIEADLSDIDFQSEHLGSTDHLSPRNANVLSTSSSFSSASSAASSEGSQSSAKLSGSLALPDSESHSDSAASHPPRAPQNNASPTEPSSDQRKQDIRFPFREDINSKVALWRGDITELNIDALVNSTNERMTSRAGVSALILDAAGQGLVDEYARQERCRTGGAGICGGYGLYAKHVIHTVGPRYNPKYRIASENALHSCYRHCLELLVENGLSTIAFPVVNIPDKGYPPEEGVHIALRTVRRFIEHHGQNIDLVVFCVDNSRDLRLYRETMAKYFPRDKEEETRAQKLLPQYTGNEFGETIVAARKIRIKGRNHDGDDNRFNQAVLNNGLASQLLDPIEDPYSYLSRDAFTEMRENPDEVRRLAELTKSRDQIDHERAENEYAGFLKRARRAVFPEFAALNFLYSSGYDEQGRAVIVFVASKFPGDLSEDQLERLLMYMVRTLDAVVNNHYVMVYVHTDIAPENKPPLQWIQQAWGRLSYKYRKNMRKLFLVHPTLWLRIVVFVLAPLVKDTFWGKLEYIQQLSQLYEYFDPEHLHLPEHCFIYDQTLTSSAWSNPTQQLTDNDRL